MNRSSLAASVTGTLLRRRLPSLPLPITAAPRLCPLETPTHAARQLTKSNLCFRKVARALKRLPVYYNSGGFLGQTLFDSKPGMHMFLELEEHWARAPCTPRLHV